MYLVLKQQLAESVYRERNILFPVWRLFMRAIHGDLEQHLLDAASRGDTPACWKWMDRGADFLAVGQDAIAAAEQNNHQRTADFLRRISSL